MPVKGRTLQLVTGLGQAVQLLHHFLSQIRVHLLLFRAVCTNSEVTTLEEGMLRAAPSCPQSVLCPSLRDRMPPERSPQL